ncbi:MAG: hypothetical protein ACRDOF_04445 [Gaiellaceae bacterium]
MKRFLDYWRGLPAPVMETPRSSTSRGGTADKDERVTFGDELERAKAGGEGWMIDKTSAKRRRVIHYWITFLWFTAAPELVPVAAAGSSRSDGVRH